MIVVEYSDKRPLVILGDFKNDNFRNESGESVGESDTSIEKRFCKSSFQNKKYIGSNDFSDLSLANDRIGVAKHDFERYHWKITTDQGNNTGIRSVVNLTNWEDKIKITF